MPGCEASLSVTDAIKKRVSVREDADPFSVSGKKLELASLVSGGRLLSLFSGLVCLPGFRSEGTQREGSDAEAAALQKIPAGKDVVHKKLLMMPCGPGRIV